MEELVACLSLGSSSKPHEIGVQLFTLSPGIISVGYVLCFQISFSKYFPAYRGPNNLLQAVPHSFRDPRFPSVQFELLPFPAPRIPLHVFLHHCTFRFCPLLSFLFDIYELVDSSSAVDRSFLFPQTLKIQVSNGGKVSKLHDSYTG